MANTLTRMQRDVLIDRVPDPADGRRALVMLTPASRQLQDQLIGAARDVNTWPRADSTRLRSTRF